MTFSDTHVMGGAIFAGVGLLVGLFIGRHLQCLEDLADATLDDLPDLDDLSDFPL
jgi:hypothetical protein